MPPKVSVVLTSYNHAPFVGGAIESVLAQTLTDFELLITDDVSTDTSWEIIQGCADPRIRAFRAERNYLERMFYGAVRNTRGEYVAIHHSDDLWVPEKLEKQAAYLDAHPECAAVFTHVQTIDEHGDCVDADFTKVFQQPNRTRHQWLRYFFDKYNALCHPSVLLRRDIALTVYTNYGPTVLPDWEKWIRICCGHEIHVLQEPLTVFRRHGKGRSDGGPATRNLVRVDMETLRALRLFRGISSPADWLKVFPEAARYVVHGEFVPDYALARLCLAHRGVAKAPYAIFGLNLLYELMDNEAERERLERLYDFRVPDLKLLSGQRDIFNVRTPRPPEPMAALALDFGQGYDWQAPLLAPAVPDMDDRYTVSFDLRPAMQANKRTPLLGFSFVPAYGQLCRHSVEHCAMDGLALHVHPTNAAEAAGGWDVFHTTVPLYQGTVERPRGAELVVTGSVQFLTMEETFTVCGRWEQEAARLQRQMRALTQATAHPPQGHCPLCDSPVFFWTPLGDELRTLQARYGLDIMTLGLELLELERFSCPHCNGMDRERIVGEYLLRRLGKGYTNPGLRLLEFAPRKALGDCIGNNFAIKRETADLFMDGVDYKLDVARMPEIADNSVDIWISLHILEHVPDDRAALREMLRILKPGGFGLLLVPLSLTLENTDEDPAASVEERWRRSGQDDHVRLYAKKDFVRRIEESGFTLRQCDAAWFGSECFTRLGLPDTAVLYVLEKI